MKRIGEGKREEWRGASREIGPHKEPETHKAAKIERGDSRREKQMKISFSWS